MRVLLDATAVPSDRAGVGRYVDSLVPELAAADIDLHLVCQESDAPHYAALAPNSTIIPGAPAIARRPVRLAWEQTALPRIAKDIRADVLHCPHYTMPLRVPCPVVVTVHDATFFSHPETHTKVKAPFFRSATRHALRSAVQCIVPSRATRDELVRLIGADPDRMSVAYLGVDRVTFHVPGEDEKQRVRASLGLGDRPYIAFLSTIQPRKNASNLVRGWVAAVAGRDNPPALVLAGGKGWDDTIDEAIAAVPDHLQVLRPGHLPTEDLSGFLGGAAVVAYPTYGEGFGLPVLEGMACGTPVLTTRRLSIPEVGGDAVSYCEPEAASIAAGIRELLDDEPLRRKLADAGRKRAVEFSWAACARSHLAVYRDAVTAPRPARTG
jgi:glycosyltransferase involved in cell wall biosynthesis